MYSYLNLGIFFKLESTSRILVCGFNMEKWVESFKPAFSVCNYCADSNLGCLSQHDVCYDLIILNTNTLREEALASSIKKAKKMLTTAGGLITLATNRYSMSKIIKECLSEKKSNWQFPAARSPAKHVNVLQQYEFDDNVGFSAFSSSDEYELLYRIESPSALEDKTGNKFIFVSGEGVSRNVGDLMSCLQGLIGGPGGGNKLRLKEIEFRPRGGGLLFVKDPVTSEEFVARYGYHEDTVELNIKQQKTINTIYAIQDMPVNLLKVIPQQYGTVNHVGFIFLLEKRLSGDLAWKVIENRMVEQNVLENACKFTFILEKATRKKICIEQKLFNKMYRDEFADILSQDFICSEVIAKYKEIVLRLETQLVGKKQSLVLSHGDYGYGNILVNDLGEITGVIDWEGARYRIPGYTLVNLLYSREKIVNNSNYEEILEKFCMKSLATGCLSDNFTEQYEEEFNIGKENIGQVVATFCLFWVFYGARFEKGYSEKRTLFFLAWALKNCFK